MIMDGNNYNMISQTASAATILAVTKPAGQAAANAAAVVSFGVNPNDSTQQGLGVGVYSTPYCIKADTLANSGFGEDFLSNCGIGTGISPANGAVTSDAAKILELNNAVEITWTLPYAIPNDRTFADIVCKTEVVSGGADGPAKYANDPLKIHQSSMIAKGWGTGNCFYLGALGTANGDHRFQCRDMGTLAKSSALQLSFQFALTNAGKTYTQGTAADATKQIVITKANTLTCELKIFTYTSAKSSAVNWYQSAWTTNIDGNTQTSASGKW